MSDGNKLPTEASPLTITLTGRPPVQVNKIDWPILSSAVEHDRYGMQIGNEALEEEDWSLRVRQHADGRAIVYAIYIYNTIRTGGRDLQIRAGELLAAGGDVVKAIERTAKEMDQRLADEGLAGAIIYRRLGNRCVAGLRPVQHRDKMAVAPAGLL